MVSKHCLTKFEFKPLLNKNYGKTFLFYCKYTLDLFCESCPRAQLPYLYVKVEFGHLFVALVFQLDNFALFRELFPETGHLLLQLL